MFGEVLERVDGGVGFRGWNTQNNKDRKGSAANQPSRANGMGTDSSTGPEANPHLFV